MTENAVTIVAHDVAGVGGMERQLRALVAGLLDRGNRVTVVSRTLDLPAHERLRWWRVRGPARPFVLAYPWFALLGSLLTARKRHGVLHTTGAIVFNRADVCTLHYLHNGPGGRVVRTRRRTPLYRLNQHVGRLMARAFEWLVLNGPLRARKLVAVSEPLAAELAAAFPERTNDVLVIRNGVDGELFAPREEWRRDVRRSLGLADGDFVALFVGSEWRGKGLAVAIEALSLIDSTHLVVVGSGDTAEMGSLAVALGIERRVRFVGETTEPERFYAAADVFVLPSEYETYSLAAFEAAAAGLPVVTTRTGAHEELFAAGAALPVDRNADSVARALKTLQSDAHVTRTMGQCGRSVASRLGWGPPIDSYVNLFARAANVLDNRAVRSFR